MKNEKKKITIYLNQENIKLLQDIKHKSHFFNKLLEEFENFKKIKKEKKISENISLKEIFSFGASFLEYKNFYLKEKGDDKIE